MTDLILFGIFPYVALSLAVAVGIYRFFIDRYSWSSHSSQFLETRALYWGSVPWHYPILIILAAHLLAFLIPSGWGAILGSPLRLYTLELIGFGLGFWALFGLLVLILRRGMSERVSAVTTPVDWIVLASLMLQMVTGIYIALTLRWGSLWYLDTATPWLWSLVTFDPQVQYLSALPLSVKIHAVNAFVLIGLLPFSRLVHLISIPLGYLARPLQVVVWNRRQS